MKQRRPKLQNFCYVIGPTGPKGKDGTSINILGSYNTELELRKNHETGTIGSAYLVGDYLYIWDDENSTWKNVGLIRGPKGEKGIQGIQGIQGPTGPKGDTGLSETITIGNVITTDSNELAKVIDRKNGLKHIFDFIIPKGLKGDKGDQGLIGPQGIKGEQGIQGIQGPTGPKGDTGFSETITIGNVITADSNEIARVIDRKNGLKHIFDFIIPQGLKGDKGEQGPIGPQGIKGEEGPTGPTGDTGRAETISIGNVTVGEQVKVTDRKEGLNHILDFVIPKGEKGDIGQGETISLGVVITGDASTFAKVVDNKQGLNHKLDFVIPRGINGSNGEKGEQGPVGPKGEKGDQGPPGPLEIPAASFVTFNVENPATGIRVNSNQKIPIDIKISDSENNFILDETNYTITIKNPGIYRADFVVYACSINDTDFLKSRDIISIGLKKPNENTIYAGASIWSDNQLPTAIVGNGIFSTSLPNDIFEFVNIGKRELYLNSPNIDDKTSSFANPLVSLIIQRLK